MATASVCKIEGCDKGGKLRRGLCGMHNQRLIRHGDPHANPAVRRHGCIVEGCDRRHAVRGYCKLHYDRFLRLGDPKAASPARIAPGTRLKWLQAHADHTGSDCLLWPFSRDRKGYARITVDGVQRCASRTMCEIVNGPPPSHDMQAAHSCGHGHLGCVHPTHLRWDTVGGNHADKIAHGTHIQGEAQGSSKLTEADVYEIRALKGRMLQREIGERFGIAQTTVGKIHRRKAWAWLKEASVPPSLPG
nr:MAG TPA: endonuclease [Caudoviricetes sp.]